MYIMKSKCIMLTCGRPVLVLANFLQKISESLYGYNQTNISVLVETLAPAPTAQVLPNTPNQCNSK